LGQIAGDFEQTVGSGKIGYRTGWVVEQTAAGVAGQIVVLAVEQIAEVVGQTVVLAAEQTVVVAVVLAAEQTVVVAVVFAETAGSPD